MPEQGLSEHTRRLTDEQRDTVSRYLHWPRYIAKKAARRLPVCEREDLEQEAVVGLMEAVVSFEPERGLKLITHATHRMHGSCLDYARCAGMIRPPRAKRNRGDVPKIRSLTHVFRHIHEEGEIDDAGSYAKTLVGILPQTREPNPTSRLESEDTFESFLSCLDAREKDVFRGLYGVEPKTMEDVGRLLGCSQSYVSQLHCRGLVRVAEWLRHLGIDAPRSPFLRLIQSETEDAEDAEDADHSIADIVGSVSRKVPREVLLALASHPDRTFSRLIKLTNRGRHAVALALKDLSCSKLILGRDGPRNRRVYRINRSAIRYLRAYFAEHGPGAIKDDFLAEMAGYTT